MAEENEETARRRSYLVHRALTEEDPLTIMNLDGDYAVNATVQSALKNFERLLDLSGSKDWAMPEPSAPAALLRIREF